VLSDLLTALVEPSPRTRAALNADAAAGTDRLAEFLSLPSGEQLRALERDLAQLNEDEALRVVAALSGELRQPFIPIPGPQTRALESTADELLFGGSAGGSKSYLLLGIAANNHTRSLLLRRQLTETDGLADDLVKMLGRAGYNKNDREHISPGPRGERSIKLGGINGPDDWQGYAGRPRDLFGFDEAGEFLEVQVVSLLSWLRSTDPGQRCRVVFASNPPRGAEGYWLNEWFAPWIEPTFERPARDGELRWCIYVKNKTRWVEGPGIYDIDGESYTAKSRTFIRARLQDNPFLSRDNVYLAQLQNRPEPLRSQLLHGDFLAGREDDSWQVIPADWVQQARQRWTPQKPDMPMTTLGIDVAQGGNDRTALAPRYGRWFAPLKVVPGGETPDGLSVATLAFAAMRDGCTIVIDLGGGWGGDAYGHLSRHLPEDALVGFMGINPSRALSVNGIERFGNLRAMAWWRFREALDPATGADIALPPDPELAAELAMPRRVPERRDILIESKEQIIKRLGRSPDKADAVVMAWCYGTERARDRQQPQRLQVVQNVGYDSAKRRRH
jgi:hypothetical protein